MWLQTEEMISALFSCFQVMGMVYVMYYSVDIVHSVVPLIIILIITAFFLVCFYHTLLSAKGLNWLSMCSCLELVLFLLVSLNSFCKAFFLTLHRWSLIMAPFENMSTVEKEELAISLAALICADAKVELTVTCRWSL